MAAARQMMHAALAALPPGCRTYAYVLDSSQGVLYQAPDQALRVQLSLERMAQAAEGLPLAHRGHVTSNARSRTLDVNSSRRKTLAAKRTALAVFPQAAGRIGCAGRRAG